MTIERSCIQRSASCNRDCSSCDLVQDTDELIQAYTMILDILDDYEHRRSQLAKARKEKKRWKNKALKLKYNI